MNKRKITEESLRQSLYNQLVHRGADTDYFIDLADKYVSLWRVAENLEADIEKRGVMYEDFSSVGIKMWKNNPSVNELTKTTSQMAKLLTQLDLSTNNVLTDGEDDEL